MPKNRPSVAGKGADIFFEDDDKTSNQQDDLSVNNKNSKSTYQNQKFKRATFYLPPDIHKRIKVESANRDMKISDFVIEIFTDYFQGKDKSDT